MSSAVSQNSELAKGLLHAGIPKVSLFIAKFSGKPASASGNSEAIPTVYF